MKLANKQLSRSAQSWINRVERRHQPKVGFEYVCQKNDMLFFRKRK